MNLDLFSRNWLFIDNSLQKKIKKQKILLIGCGLGSSIADILVRTGFENLTIVDGDNVELSNLNRQQYYLNDINKSKSSQTATYLKNINSNCKISFINKYFNKLDLVNEIPKHDIIINTIDFDNIAFYECNEICLQLKKTEFIPITLGFGGIVLNTNEFKQSLRTFFNEFNNLEKLKLHIIEYILNDLKNNELNKLFQQYNDNTKQYDPQISIGTKIVSSIVTYLILQKVKESKLNKKMYHIVLNMIL